MKAIISTNYDDKYLFFLPIAVWCWNKLGVECIIMMPNISTPDENRRVDLLVSTKKVAGLSFEWHGFDCPERKEATYTQCSRLYASEYCKDPNEVLITSDVDMANFRLPPPLMTAFGVWGNDLVPDRQFPMCYVYGTAYAWDVFLNKGRTTQECLDYLLEDIECENFKGNYWAKDQEEIYKSLALASVTNWNRARKGTQFADNRADRDDTNWRSYIGPDLIDAHLWRPGYTDANFANILELLTAQYPDEDFQWLINYRNEYIKLL